MTKKQDMHWLHNDTPNGEDAGETTRFVHETVSEKLETELGINAEEVFTEGGDGQKKFGAEVDLRTLDRLQAMTDKSKRATVYHTANVVKKGEFHYAPGEPDTIIEFMTSALDANDMTPGEFSDLTFIASELVPYLSNNNIPNAAVLWASGFKSKTRAAIPVLRYLFTKAPDNLKDEVTDIISWIVDPTRTFDEMREYAKKKRGITAPDPAYAYETILADNMTELVIKCNAIQYKAIIKKLKNLIDLHSSAPFEADDQGASI